MYTHMIDIQIIVNYSEYIRKLLIQLAIQTFHENCMTINYSRERKKRSFNWTR